VLPVHEAARDARYRKPAVGDVLHDDATPPRNNALPTWCRRARRRTCEGSCRPVPRRDIRPARAAACNQVSKVFAPPLEARVPRMRPA